ncbi:MAG: hypothetical protein JO211_09890 [Acidobacteriaceae bacterium]|nr:hypothetical protein [Acidobacteriaceae bacterium]
MNAIRLLVPVSCVLIFVSICGARVDAENEELQRAYSDMYNLNFAQAHRAIAEFEAVHPDDPLGPVSDAAACLFSEFDRLHILQSEFFVNDSAITTSKKLSADPAVKAKFDDDLSKTERLAAAEMHRPGGHAGAMFANTLRLGLHADYLALIEKRDLAALSEMKKGRQLAEELLSQQPTYYDAYIAVGVENYLLSLKPAPVRWLLRATGAETDKQNGIDKLRLTAEHGGYLAPYARLLLAVAALRDGNRKKARELLSWLADHYPQNALYRQELSKLR